MTVSDPQVNQKPGSSRVVGVPRVALPTPVRIGLVLLLAISLYMTWRPIPASPDALAVGNQFMREQYAGYTFAEPATESRLFGTTVLTFATTHRGTPARVILTLGREAGELVVKGADLVLGTADGKRITTWFISFLLALGLLYLVFFVSIPRTFGRKCPRDLSLLTMTESVVVPAQVDVSGIGLAPIIERRYACKHCDFHHCEVLTDPTYRPSVPSS